MPDRTSVVSEFKTRLREFQEGYEWEESDGILRSFTVVGELLEIAFDPITAARGMEAMRLVTNSAHTKPINWSKLSADAPIDWAEWWRDLDAFDHTSWSPLMENAHNLNAFAYFGILPTWALPDADRTLAQFHDVPAYVRGVVNQLNRFVQLLPKTLDLYGIEVIERTCLAVIGRLKIDASEPLSVHELAALSQVTTKRLQNAIYAKSADAPIANKDGTIPAAATQRWLEARDYKPSIWREVIACKGWEENGDAIIPTTAENEVGDFLFVPEARDGTVFSPIACKRGGKCGTPHYTVGAKDSEVDYENYQEALAALSKMSTPRWRRPNENGNFGIVSAERWRRLTREELFSI